MRATDSSKTPNNCSLSFRARNKKPWNDLSLLRLGPKRALHLKVRGNLPKKDLSPSIMRRPSMLGPTRILAIPQSDMKLTRNPRSYKSFNNSKRPWSKRIWPNQRRDPSERSRNRLKSHKMKVHKLRWLNTTSHKKRTQFKKRLKHLNKSKKKLQRLSLKPKRIVIMKSRRAQ